MKKRLLCPKLPTPGHPVLLSETEAHHATHVLRLREGQIVQAIDGNQGSALVILRTKDGPIRVEYTERFAEETNSFQAPSSAVIPMTLEVAILKAQAMEWVIEKAVELGVDRIRPVLTIRTVVKVSENDTSKFLLRWNRIAEQAMKQSGRLRRLEILPPLSLEKLLGVPLKQDETRAWCDEASESTTPELLPWLQSSYSQSLRHLHLLLGPEGGWDPRERDHLSREKNNYRVGLGPLTLRAETAALYASCVFHSYYRLTQAQEGS